MTAQHAPAKPRKPETTAGEADPSATLELSPEAFDHFLATCASPAEPTAELRALLAGRAVKRKPCPA
jgi:hypothetical protein